MINTIVRFATAALLTLAHAVDKPEPAQARPDAKVYRTSATAYCLQGRTASGTYVNKRTAAHNFLRPGTKIRLVGRPFIGGIRRFIIRDTGSALGDGHLDLWTGSCAAAIQWGRRPVAYKRGWGKP